MLLQFRRDYSGPNDDEGTQRTQGITFYELNPDGSYENGTTIEEVLRVAKERLKDMDKRFSCKENKRAIKDIDSAINWLELRTADRKRRGVEGKHLV